MRNVLLLHQSKATYYVTNDKKQHQTCTRDTISLKEVSKEPDQRMGSITYKQQQKKEKRKKVISH